MARILVIGGEDLFGAVRGPLVSRGYLVARAADIAHARTDDETPADLIIAGPHCADGAERDALLGLIKDNPKLKVIAVSKAGTDAYLETQAAAAARGVLGTISLPIEPTELLYHVRACLEPLD